MSHVASAWAIRQRGLEPVTKLLLMMLADAHNPDMGCFPSQARLADELEVARGTVNRHLTKLVQKGLIKRMRHRDEKTKRQARTRYYLAFEAGFGTIPDADGRVSDWDTEQGLPPNDDAESRVSDLDTGAVSQNPGSRVSPETDSVSHSWDSNTDKPVIEPVKEPVRRGGAREGCHEQPVGGSGGGVARPEGHTTDKHQRGSWRLLEGVDAELAERQMVTAFVDWLVGKPYDAYGLTVIAARPLYLKPGNHAEFILGLTGPERKKVESWISWAGRLLAGDPHVAEPPAGLDGMRRLLAALRDPVASGAVRARCSQLMGEAQAAAVGVGAPQMGGAA